MNVSVIYLFEGGGSVLVVGLWRRGFLGVILLVGYSEVLLVLVSVLGVDVGVLW